MINMHSFIDEMVKIADAAAHSPLALAAGSLAVGVGGTAGASAFRNRRRAQAQQG